MAYFLATETHGPAWDPALPRREQAGFAEHAALMDAWVADGTILLGGPLGDSVDAGDVLLVVRGEDEGDVRRTLAADHWVGTVLTVSAVQRWSLWLLPPALTPGQP